MTISNNGSLTQLVGNGVLTIFNIPFRIFSETECEIFIGTVLQTLTTDYTISAITDSGFVLTFVIAPANLAVITVERNTNTERQTDYNDQGLFDADVINNEQDRNIALHQEVISDLDRTITLASTVVFSGSLELEQPASNQLIGWNSTATALENKVPLDLSLTTVSVFMTTFLDDSDAAEARATLGDAPIVDNNGNELIGFSGTTSAVNEITITNAATLGSPTISVTGGDTNIGVDYQTKGTGIHRLLDGSGNEVLIIGSGVSSAVNEITITNAATGNSPSIAPTGSDTNIGLDVTLKGTGVMAVAGTGGVDIAGPIKRGGKVLAEEVLDSGTVSGAASLDITDLPDGYRCFKLYFDDLQPAGDNVSLFFRTSTDNGATFTASAGAYQWTSTGLNSNTPTEVNRGSTSATTVELASAVGGSAGEEGAGQITIFNPTNATGYTHLLAEMSYSSFDPTPQNLSRRTSGKRLAAEDNDAFQILFATGNIASMNWTLTGMRAS